MSTYDTERRLLLRLFATSARYREEVLLLTTRLCLHRFLENSKLAVQMVSKFLTKVPRELVSVRLSLVVLR